MLVAKTILSEWEGIFSVKLYIDKPTIDQEGKSEWFKSRAFITQKLIRKQQLDAVKFVRH